MEFTQAIWSLRVIVIDLYGPILRDDSCDDRDSLEEIQHTQPLTEKSRLFAQVAGQPASLTVTQIQEAFASAPMIADHLANKMVALACDDSGNLNAVSTCWERLPDGRVGGREYTSSNLVALNCLVIAPTFTSNESLCL